MWYDNLKQIKQFIDEYNKKPSQHSKNKEETVLGCWISTQQKNYNNATYIMKVEYRQNWEEFINDLKYKQYFMSKDEIWYNNLNKVKGFIDNNNKRPSKNAKNKEERILGLWIKTKQKNYKDEKLIMKEIKFRNEWEKFVLNPQYAKYFNTDYISDEIKEKYEDFDFTENNMEDIEELSEEEIEDKPRKPVKKSVYLKPKKEKTEETQESKIKRATSAYQKIGKKMSQQKSINTKQMFELDESLWHQYHDNRDISFKGFDVQDEIPINKIINYLETRKNHRLKILDLGCGRNLIHQHFKDNKKLSVTGYDYVSNNGSEVCDISDMPDEYDSVNICVMSQALMGHNWKEYIDEAVRVLMYNGELIISESTERYDSIKEYLEEKEMYIKEDEYDEGKRWFMIKCLKG